MSQPSSPFSQPAMETSPPPRPGIGTAAVIAICLTLLLMCGGVLAVAYVAIDRLAAVIEDATFDEFDDDETPEALEFALADVAAVTDRVGEITSVEVNEPLTYDIKGYSPEYYYDVTGESGTITIAVWFDETDDPSAWFERVAVVTDEGELIETLSVPKVPFDSLMSYRVYEKVKHAPEVAAQIGEVTLVLTDWERSATAELGSEPVQIFEVRGAEGTITVRATFTQYDYETVESAAWVSDDGTQTPITLTGDGVMPESAEPADENGEPETEPAPESAGAEATE